MTSIIYKSIVLTAIMLMSSQLAAQGIGVSSGPNGVRLSGFGDVNLEKTVENWSKLQREEIQLRTELQIQQIRDTCGLSDNESKKVRLAVKGIISKRLAAGNEQIHEFALNSGLVEKDPDENDGDENEKVDEEKDYGPNRLKFYGARPMPEGVVNLSCYFETPLSEHPLWVKTVQKTLSAEQFEKYEAMRIDRNQKLMNAAIDSWVAQLDSQVFLTSGQMEKVTEQVRSTMKKDVTLTTPVSLKQASMMVNKQFGMDYQSLGDLLNEQQTTRREKLLPRGGGGARVSWGAGPNR